MSNKFLHFRQVIDSRTQKRTGEARKLWKAQAIGSIKVMTQDKEIIGFR